MGRQTRSIQAIRQDFQTSLSWTVASAAAAVGPITKRRGEEHSLSLWGPALPTLAFTSCWHTQLS